jgi:hypothetical protein
MVRPGADAHALSDRCRRPAFPQMDSQRLPADWEKNLPLEYIEAGTVTRAPR